MTTRVRWHPNRPPKIDTRDTGVTFVDVLFALVVGKILEVSVGGPLPAAAISHLFVAAVLTIGSWVGYHNSVNRVNYFLRFWNFQTLLFLIDVLLVYDYWLVPVMTVHYRIAGSSSPPEAFRSTALVTAAALLYIAWDFIALRMRRSGKYEERPADQDVPARRYASIALFILTAATLAVVCWKQPHTDAPVILVDGILVVLLILYRTIKEGLTPAAALTPAGSRSTS